MLMDEDSRSSKYMARWLGRLFPDPAVEIDDKAPWVYY